MSRHVVALQVAYDESARASFDRWDRDGIPPSAYTVGSFRFSVAIDARMVAKSRAGDRSTIEARPGVAPSGTLRVGIRLVRPEHVVASLADPVMRGEVP
jgi:hypothetical protein